MSEVVAIVMVGPRGVGKTTFCKQMSKYPGVVHINRDGILIEYFGSISSNGYDGKYPYAQEVMFDRVSEISKNGSKQVILFDHWTGYPESRREIVKKLRECGIKTVIAWYFITSLKVGLKWLEDDPNDWCSESAFITGFQSCHKLATDITEWKPRKKRSDDEWWEEQFPSDIFDKIVRINPLQLILPRTLPGIGLLPEIQKGQGSTQIPQLTCPGS